MAHINLLPWRAELRKQKKQEFFTQLGIVSFLMGLVVLSVHMYMAGLIENQEARNTTLKNEIAIVEKKIAEISELERQKEQLIARMRVIESLQSNRPAVVHLFDDMPRLVPEGVYIQTMEQKGNLILIKGVAQSNARVSAFMRALEASEWFESPVLDVIATKRSAQEKSREFTLRVTQSSAKGPAK